jgi:hypothetical protein
MDPKEMEWLSLDYINVADDRHTGRAVVEE